MQLQIISNKSSLRKLNKNKENNLGKYISSGKERRDRLKEEICPKMELTSREPGIRLSEVRSRWFKIRWQFWRIISYRKYKDVKAQSWKLCISHNRTDASVLIGLVRWLQGKPVAAKSDVVSIPRTCGKPGRPKTFSEVLMRGQRRTLVLSTCLDLADLELEPWPKMSHC